MIELNLRQSWISTFLRCPEQARQERAGLVQQRESSDMLRGNAVHYAIEEAGAAKLSGREAELDMMLNAAERYITDHAHEVDEWRTELEPLVETVRANVECWHTELNPILFPRPDGIERMFMKNMGIREVDGYDLPVRLNLVGTADWIDQSGVIWD